MSEMLDEELIATRILNGSMSKKEIVEYVSDLQKKNEQLRNQIEGVSALYKDTCKSLAYDYISKQAIKEKIEELENNSIVDTIEGTEQDIKLLKELLKEE